MLRIANATLLATTLTCAGGATLCAAETDHPVHVTELDRVTRLIDAQDFASAKSVAHALIEKHAAAPLESEQSIAGGAYAALGRIYVTEAEQQATRGRALWANIAYADARWAYLNAMTYLVSDDEDAADALYQAGLCYSKLTAVESDAATNAQRTWKAVLRWYAQSRAAKLARKQLQAAGVNPEN